MDLNAVLERWLPLVLVSVLFFVIIKAFLGAAFRQLLRPVVLIGLLLLVVTGVVPLHTVEQGVTNLFVFLFGIVQSAYEVAVLQAAP